MSQPRVQQSMTAGELGAIAARSVPPINDAQALAAARLLAAAPINPMRTHRETSTDTRTEENS